MIISGAHLPGVIYIKPLQGYFVFRKRSTSTPAWLRMALRVPTGMSPE